MAPGPFLCERVPEFLNRVLHLSLTALTVAVFLISAYCVYDAGYLYYHAGNKPYRENKPRDHQTVTSERQISDDQAAWLYIDGTGIDDPVMQADNNIKYLNLDPYGDFALHGSLFLDYRNNSDFTDRYSIIYGHHMEHWLMFGCLDEYRDASFAKDHRDGTVTGREDIYRMHIFAVLETDAHDPIFFDPEKFDWEKLMDKARGSSFFFEEPEKDNPILCLSTCTDSVGSSRLVVLGTLKKGEQQ